MQQRQLDAAILAVVIVKERSRCVYIIMVVYPWRAASTNAQHRLDAAILAIVIVKEHSRRVYIMMAVYPYMCNDNSSMLLYWQL